MEQHIFTNKDLNFKEWAIRLGCPISALPNDSGLNRCMKSFDKNSLFKVMNMVRPRNEVKTMRNNILLESASTLSVLQAKTSNKTLQTNKNIKKVQKSIKDIIPRVEERKAAAISKQEVIYDKGMQVMELKKAWKDYQGMYVQFEEKRSELMDKLNKEKEFDDFIQKSTPVDTTKSKTDSSHADNAIEKSVTLLKRAYEAIGDRPITNNVKAKLEEELEKIIANIPSSVLLQPMKSHNNQQMKLVEKYLNNIQPFETSTGSMSSFRISRTKTKAKIFRMHLEVIELKEEEQRHIEHYTTIYVQVFDNILRQMRIFNLDDSEIDSESICAEYLKEFITWHSNKALSEYYEKLFSHWQTIVSNRDDQLKTSEFVILELCDLYGKIEKYYNDIMDDVSALGVVNKKLKYLQELSTYTINSTRNWNIGNSSRSVFNNTKSVLDVSTFGRHATTTSINSTPAKYLNEILMLSDIPTDKWNATLPVNISMEIAGQLANIEISPLFSFLTPNAALKESKLKCAWHRLISNFAPAVKYGTVPEFKKFQIVSENVIYESESMSELVKERKLRDDENNISLIACQKYLKFLLNTSIGSLIPPKMKINGRSYRDYEEEFLCICSLLRDQSKQ